MSDSKKEANAITHVEWLAREQRHTSSKDDLYLEAASRQWCEPVVGTIRDMFRVRLTELGRAELARREIASAHCNTQD